MGRKKYQANCRIQHRRRKRAKRAALLAAEAAAAAAQKGEGVEGEGQGTAAATASHTASELPTEQFASPPNPVSQIQEMTGSGCIHGFCRLTSPAAAKSKDTKAKAQDQGDRRQRAAQSG